MAYKTNERVKRILQEKFKDVVTDYLLELCNMWDFDPANGWFVGDEVGDVWCYGDNIFICFDDMRYVVEHDVSYDTYRDWMDYRLWASDFGQDTPNLNAWCRGCPRVDNATQVKLSAMKLDLEKEIGRVTGKHKQINIS